MNFYFSFSSSFIQDSCDRHKDYCSGGCSRGEQFASTLSITRESEDLKPRSRTEGWSEEGGSL